LAVLEVLGIVAVVLIPILLLGALFVYLKRTAPGGVVPAPGAPEPPKAERATKGPGARVTGAQTCGKCGMTVTAAMIGGSTPRCQNCNAALPMA
jgi:hypothetical protein